ncbi:hypothetical protein NXF25_016623, partial [Crotalus adamanteus]
TQCTAIPTILHLSFSATSLCPRVFGNLTFQSGTRWRGDTFHKRIEDSQSNMNASSKRLGLSKCRTLTPAFWPQHLYLGRASKAEDPPDILNLLSSSGTSQLQPHFWTPLADHALKQPGQR